MPEKVNCNSNIAILQFVSNCDTLSYKGGSEMEFDVRYRDYTFKHSYSPKPDMNAEHFREHYHTSYEMLFFVKGNADFMLQHTRYSIKPGSLLIAKPGEYHNIVFNTDEPYDRYVIRFDPASIHHHVRRRLEQAESVYHIANTDIAALFYLMDEFLSIVHIDMRLSACIGSLNIIISYLVSSMDLVQKADYVNDESRKIAEYIDRHLAEINSAEDLTAALHMSKSALYKTFSAQFDTPIMSYIRTQKCMAARKLMYDGVSAMDAAERLGFNHYSSFYRDYQRVFHESPTGATK